MSIRITPKAVKQLSKCAKFDQVAIARKIRKILLSDKSGGIIKVKGYDNLFRVRVGNYRIVFQMKGLIYIIVLVGHRKDVYKVFKQMNVM